jgi:site-specific recombinase XerD
LTAQISRNVDVCKWKDKLKFKYANSKETQDKYKSLIIAFETWIKKNNISEAEVCVDIVEQYILKEVIEKKLSKSKLDLVVAALNFKYENIFKIKAPKYKGGEK